MEKKAVMFKRTDQYVPGGSNLRASWRWLHGNLHPKGHDKHSQPQHLHYHKENVPSCARRRSQLAPSSIAMLSCAGVDTGQGRNCLHVNVLYTRLPHCLMLIREALRALLA
jgi:hypothetical protein